jgi:cathepsin B
MFKNLLFIILINFIKLISSEDSSELIPESFDSRQKWPNCIPKIQDQGACGACYAFSISTAFSMRYCIRNELSQIINFSPQNLVNCLSGCKGEFPDVVWGYINNNGITTENCLSYKGYENNCVIKCDINDIPFNKYYSGQTKFLENENEIKKEILKNGPVTSMMNLYTDYYDYTSGIYIHNTKYNNVLGYHSITIMGWGIDNGIKYWLIQDSYGKSKGDNGFIKIKIGDDCGAGATAFCDEKEGKYNEYKSDDNNQDKDTDENPKIVPKKNKSMNLYRKEYSIFLLFFILFIL